MEIIELFAKKKAEYFINKAVFCENDLDIPGAIKFYDKAIKANPHSYDAYNFRGIMKMSAHDDKGSMLDFSMAIEINPHFKYA